MNIQTVCHWLGLPSDNTTEITGFSTDTRTLKPGNAFIALHGENFDGHDFLQRAHDMGAVLAIVHHQNPTIPLMQLEVSDTLKSLGLMATEYRKTLRCPVISLTGSNGKTTVKEMIAAILPKPSYATEGNLNNHIGVPLSVLRINADHQYAVLELGANHIGEIAYTTAIAAPDVVLINNIAPAHIGEFGSIEGVAKTKGEIYQGLKPQGVAVVNDDDAYAHFWDEHLKDKRVIRFSKEKVADIYATDITLDAKGCASFTINWENSRYSVSLNLPGKHMVSNALAASACCLGIGLSMTTIIEGLESFSGVKGRLQHKAGLQGAVIIDDTYNANLKSVLTALDVLAHCQGTRYFIMGDMGELGEHAIAHHEAVGLHAKELGIDGIFTVGDLTTYTNKAFGPTAQHFVDKPSLITALLPLLNTNATVLVKGSRSAKMEEIVAALS